MQDNNTKNIDNNWQNEVKKRRSFFWWEINAKAKDLLDFRYNTQEEIDKLNDEMATTSELDEIIQQTNSLENNDDNEDFENVENFENEGKVEDNEYNEEEEQQQKEEKFKAIEW